MCILLFSGLCESVTWQFHCCLASEHCHFELSSDPDNHNITISATLGKDLDYFNAGQSVLPLRIIEDHELTPFHSPSQSKDYMETTRLHEAMFTSTQDVELKRLAGFTKITDPFFCLRETIADLWKNVYHRPGVRFCSISSRSHCIHYDLLST